MEIKSSGINPYNNFNIIAQFSQTEHSHQATTARVSEDIKRENKDTAQTPTVATSPLSHAIYASAAQYQVYTQAGTLQSILSNAHAPSSAPAPHKDEVSAVEKSESSSVDLRL